MFDLIDDVERYPEFLPWCDGARVSHRDEHTTCAEIDIRYAGVAQSFSTENRKDRPTRMTLDLVDGPFKSLHGTWHLLPLGDDACKIEFDLEYAFGSAAVERVLEPVMAMIANTFMDRFARRAETLFREAAQ